MDSIKQPTNKIPISVIASCFIAGGLEMYDFLIFGFLASVIHKNYLSFLDKDMALIVTYLFFAVGFFFRPLGSIIFGQIGDRYGRKIALVLSVSCMGIASLTMSLLPSYELIGIAACFIIVLVRIIQGLSVGGEYSGAIIYAMEHIDKKNVGIVGGTVLCGCTLGVILAFIVSKTLQSDSLPSYSWRFAFLLGFGLSIVGYFIRRKLRETPIFQASASLRLKLPLLYGLKKLKIKMLSAVCLAGASNANFYFAMVFIPNYLKGEQLGNTGFSGLFLISLMFCMVPVVGWLCDNISRRNIIALSILMIGLYDLFFLSLVMNTADSQLVTLYTIFYAMLLSVVLVVSNVLILEVFPVECRFSCGATSYSIGAALFGGTAPVICSLIVKTYEYNVFYIGLYIAFVSLLGLGGALVLFPKRSKTTDESLSTKMSEPEYS
ncbi:MAG: MFS transporter [Rickettsiaceae bacterium]|nr:MFS transporter [Rickettsiaceae bacterium]